MVIIEDAIDESRFIEFECKQEKDKRKVEPLKVANFDGYWYLVAKDISENDKIKTFYLKECKRLKMIEEQFDDKCEKLQKKARQCHNNTIDQRA